MKLRKWPKKLTRKYLRVASVYRRFAGRSTHYDFSLEMLLECYEHESNGGPVSKKNGYIFGKWAKDISVATWREDIQAGTFAKFEFYTPLDRWWTEPALKGVIVSVPWFPHERNDLRKLKENAISKSRSANMESEIDVRKEFGFVPADAKIEIISWPEL